MKKIFKALKNHRKSILALSLIVLITAVIYTDPLGSIRETPVSEYLYNSDLADSEARILGEATLVDNKDGLIENDRYFSVAAVNREKSRDEALETLQVVVDSAEEFPETRDKALSEILEIASNIEIEATVEEMIKAKGFEDCVAIVSGDNINVIVKSDGLLTSEVAQITDIVMGETGFSAGNIRIVEKV